MIPPSPSRAGRLAENVMHFCRVLRAAGLPVGTDRVRTALQALQVAGLERRDDFREVLRCCLVDRVEHEAVFDQAFHLFWRDPDLLGRAMAMLLPRLEGPKEKLPPPKENRRLAEALFPNMPQVEPPEAKEPPVEIDAQLTFSEREILRKTDFDTMTPQEWLAARRLLAARIPLLPTLKTRRMAPGHRPERLDWRRIAARSARRGGELSALAWMQRQERPAPIVALVDISGSMSRYSRMFLHFLHALTGSGRSVRSFLFGTRLTPVTRALRGKDPDVAVAACVRAVEDWSGGTRIAACLHDFNRDWSRRVLGQNAIVLLVTDGLERDDAGSLRAEAERLRLRCRSLVWLNPLLRFDGFEPRAAGVRTLLAQADRMLPVHDLDSLERLADLLRHPPSHGGWPANASLPS